MFSNGIFHASFGSHADIPVPQIDWQWNWLHIQGRYIVFDDKVADQTASFSSIEHLCVSRQSLTDTELFQFEWVPDQSKSKSSIIHDAAMMLLL